MYIYRTKYITVLMRKILFLSLLITTGAIAQTKKTVKSTTANGKLQGNVTYLSESTEPRNPDAGTVVVMHLSAVEQESANDTFGTYFKAKTYITLSKIDAVHASSYLDKLKNINAETPEKFEVIDKATLENYYRVKKDPKSIVTVADAAGNYSANLKPGRYEVIFLSNNKKDQNTYTEFGGLIYYYYVTIKPGETTIKDYNFY
jgi:hypothetical protein